MEKSRVLQEALHALATEHHELEQSIAVRKPSTQRYYDTDEDEFYDCDEENLENTEGLYICLLSNHKIYTLIFIKQIWIPKNAGKTILSMYNMHRKYMYAGAMFF